MTFFFPPLGFCQHVVFRFCLSQQNEYAAFCLAPVDLRGLFVGLLPFYPLISHLTT